MTGTLPYIAAHPPDVQTPGLMRAPAAGSVEGPLVSCLMVTRGDRPTLPHAIACFRRQSYRNRELVIVTDRPGTPLEALVAGIGDPAIRLHLVEEAPLGALRNRAAAVARGDLIAQWDDDDLSHPRRLDIQVAALAGRPATAASFLLRWTIWWPARRLLARSSRRCWEASMLIRRAALAPYPPLRIGEDFALVADLRAAHPVIAVDAPDAYVYVVHGRNTCDTAHFERLFFNATERLDHDAGVARLAADLPMEEYRAALDVRSDVRLI